MSDSSKEIILLVGQNLFFLGRVENLAEPLGYEVQYTTTESAFWDAYGSGQIALILVDLEGDESIWRKVLEGIRQQGAGAVKVVGFGPHENATMLERARNLGCDLVLNKGEFNRDLPKIIERRGEKPINS